MIKKRLVGTLSHAKKYIVYNILWQWISLLAQAAAVFAAAGLLNQILMGAESREGIIKTIAVLIPAIAVRFVCERLAAKASYNASVDVKRILRKRVYDKLLRLGTAYRDKAATSEVTQVCTEGVEQLEIYFGKYLPQLFYSLLAPVTLFIILMRVNLRASIVLLVCVPLIPISIVAVQKIAKKLLNKYWGIYMGLGDSFLENLQGLTTLKIYQADEKRALEMDEEAQRFRQITMKVLTMQLNSTSVMDIVAYGGAAVGMIVAIREYIAGSIGLTGALIIILLASEFFIPLRLLGSFFHIAMNGMTASDKLFRILDLAEGKKGEKSINNAESDITIRNLSFSYEESREILTNIDMEIKSGLFVSLVGESGCGKSTIANLLSGRNKGYAGSIKIGDTEISDIKEESLLEYVTVVRHNSYLFKGSVEDNLRMAKPDVTESEMNDVLKQVNLYEFLQTQSGLNTMLLEQASNFSGGQRQRLALARALLHDSPMYIFDEATSNIDVESEEMIMKVIHRLAKQKTVLLISHRLSNVIKSDTIYYMDKGRVAESGTQPELMEGDGGYKKLYNGQLELEAFGKEISA